MKIDTRAEVHYGMIPMNKHLFAIVVILALVGGTKSFAATSAWRGDGSGRYPKARPPLRWSSETNVIWRTPLPKWSNASPVLAGRRLFVCVEPTTLVCLSAKDGTILWERELSYADIEPPEKREQARKDQERVHGLKGEVGQCEKQLKEAKKKLETEPSNETLKTEVQSLEKRLNSLRADFKKISHYLLPASQVVNGYSTPTPVTDGKYVYVLTGTGVAACFDLKGNRRWARLVEKSSLGWGLSTSPVLAGDRFVVHINKVTGLDKHTGETAWETPSAGKYGSMFASRIGKTPIVLTANGEILRASDGAALGAKILSLAYNGPVVHEDVAYFVQHGGKAARLPSEFDPDGAAEILWTTKPHNDRYYGSPLYHEGLIYAITQKYVLSVIDAATGEIVYSQNMKLAGTVYPSITLAGQYLFVSSDDGTTIVMKPGRTYEEVARNKLEGFRTSPLFEKDRLYIRGLNHVYCIGPKP
ncbi:MAG: PQQ-binding-like beta-propeller repeat protein [Lentisphaerae bacterium]|nr:PQQ-binding-like beta-propeller repeat protein [Lentisphaerota bacterium]